MSILLILGHTACDTAAQSDGYMHIGTGVFRRSYAGHENWTERQLDSASRADPLYITTSGHGDTVLRILNAMGVAEDHRLLLDANERDMRDTLVIASGGSESETAYIEKDTIDWQMTLCIKSRRTTYRFPIEEVSSSFVAYLLPDRDGDHPFIAVLQYYYIMNGDNYEVAVYGKPDPRYGDK